MSSIGENSHSPRAPGQLTWRPPAHLTPTRHLTATCRNPFPASPKPAPPRLPRGEMATTHPPGDSGHDPGLALGTRTSSRGQTCWLCPRGTCDHSPGAVGLQSRSRVLGFPGLTAAGAQKAQAPERSSRTCRLAPRSSLAPLRLRLGCSFGHSLGCPPPP